jgi:hypothetical protein
MNNVAELKRIKDIHRKILGFQVLNSEHGTPFVPKTNRFEKTWKTVDLPPFHLDESSAHQIAERSCGWIIYHQGFDGKFLLIFRNKYRRYFEFS